MPTFSADQIIGKSLIAKKPVVVYDLPFYEKQAKQIAVIKPGALVGRVFSYVGGQPGRPLNWEFIGQNKKTYYVPHVESYFSVEALRDQGVQTTAEAKAAEEEKDMSFSDKLAEYFKKSGKVVLYGGLALIALNVILKNRKA
jgi:hypothetical protein